MRAETQQPLEHDSFADLPWIIKLVEYTAKILSEGKVRVIGVCFGHQIVGRALKARVGRNPGGWEAAVNDVQLTEKGKDLFGVDQLVCFVAIVLCHLLDSDSSCALV